MGPDPRHLVKSSKNELDCCFLLCHETLKILNIASKTFILLLNYSPILGEDALDKIKLFTAQSSEAAKDI